MSDSFAGLRIGGGAGGSNLTRGLPVVNDISHLGGGGHSLLLFIIYPLNLTLQCGPSEVASLQTDAENNPD